MISVRPFAAAAAILLGSLGLAAAQMPTDAQKNAIRSACRSDFMAHCSGVQPGGQAALSCLQQNMTALSSACRSAVGALGGGGASTSAMPPAAPESPPAQAALPASPRTEMALIARACRPDYRIFCRGVRPGGGAVLGCLRANAESLSPACRDGLMAARR
jgi:hypothetical protein